MTRADSETTHREDVGRVPRRRGVVNGFLLVLLGLWGAAVPLFGPYLGLSYGTDSAWQFTGDWFLLSLVPGVAVVLGGLGLMATAQRAGGVLWGWLAALGGAWFILGPVVSRLWNGEQSAVAGSTGGQVVTDLLVHSGLGTLIVFLAAVALGRFTAGTGRTIVSYPGDDTADRTDPIDRTDRTDSIDRTDRTDRIATTDPTEVPAQDHGRHDATVRTTAADGRTTRDDVYAQGTRDTAARPDSGYTDRGGDPDRGPTERGYTGPRDEGLPGDQRGPGVTNR